MVFKNIDKANKIETSKGVNDQAKKVESKPKTKEVTHLIPVKTK